MLALALLFAKRKGVSIVAADMPEIIYREQFCNPLTMAQLKQILTESATECALNPDAKPETPLNMYMTRAPGYALQPSDAYMSSLIEYIIEAKDYKRTLVIGGLGQAHGIKATLVNRAPIALDKLLGVPPLNANIYGKVLLEDFVEKQSIFDVLSMGKLLLKKNELLFRNSRALIEKYSGLEPDHPKQAYYRQMHEDFVHHHFKLFMKRYNLGQEKKKDYFVERVITANKS